MAIKIGTISIQLTAETASFQSGMDRASQVALNSSRNIERSFSMMATAITAATGAAVGALGLLIDKTEETVFQMQKAAQQAGVSIETFSKLSYAAKVAGMPTDQLAVIMTRLAHAQLLAAGGSKEQASAFKALGVNVSDSNGHFLNTGDLVIQVAKALDGFKDSANKTGIETIIMGRSGAQAASLMNVLANRFDELSAKAEKMGVVITGPMADGAQKLHDQLVDLEAAGLGLSVRLLQQVSPALDSVIQKIVALASSPDSMKKIAEIGKELGDGIELAGKALEFLVNHFDAVKRVIEGLALLRLGGMFGPMILSATEASGFFGKLSIATLNLTGNLLGIKKAGTVMAPLAKDAMGYAGALKSLAAEEGVAGAASIAFGDALAGISAAAPPLIILSAVTIGLKSIYDEGKAIYDLNAQLTESGKSWFDDWTERSALLEKRLLSVKNVLWNLALPGIGTIKAQTEALGDYRSNIAGRQMTANSKMAKSPGLPDGYDPKTGYFPVKKDMPGLSPASKGDELAKRLAELKEKAAAAQRALELVGALPQAQRDSEILEKYNLFLAEQKQLLDKLSPAKKADAEAQAHTAITTEVNAEAATKYAQAVVELDQALSSTTQEHLDMAVAVGKSAQAMQDAAVAAKVNQEMLKLGGVDWRNDPSMQYTAKFLGDKYRADANATNLEASNKSIATSQRELEAQNRLNDAILRGSDVRREAQVDSEEAAVRQDYADRGDTNQTAMQAQINLIRQKSDADKVASDLERASSMNVTLRYQEQTKQIQDAVLAAERYGQSIDYTQVLAADKEAWLQYVEAQDKAILATGSMLDGLKVALDQMGREVESSAQLMHDAFMNAVNSMNDAIAKIMTTKNVAGSHLAKNAFGGAFKGIADNLAKTGIQRGESAILGKLGAGKPDGTSQNPWYVKIAGLVGGGSSIGSALASIGTGGRAGMPQTTSANPVESIALSAMKLFLPGFAGGTDSMVPGMASIVGEKGPEIFVPPSSGSIVPNSALKNGLGGSPTFHIDARGAADPAQTVALIHQYMTKAAPQMMASTMKAARESKLRVAQIAAR